MGKPLLKIVKEYPAKGPIKQFRFEKAFTFHCTRCRANKTAKLVSIYNENWSNKICNGCYGYLLAIYNIKSSHDSTDVKADLLAKLLLNMAEANELSREISKNTLKNNKAAYLNSSSIKFYDTSEFVASSLEATNNLDWSPAVIGICKAFELEIVEKLINHLKDECLSLNIPEWETKDKDFGKIVSYCIGKSTTPPELGSIAYFLRVASTSKNRIESSEFLNKGLLRFLSKRPYSSWLIEKDGLAAKLEILTKSFRNKAAHTDELSSTEYRECKEFVFGETGIMWDFLQSLS